MKKLFLKLKMMFVSWLLKEHIATINKKINTELSFRDNRISELENHMRMVKAVTNIGVDLQDPNYGRSWIAVCIRGNKQQWVQFFDGSDDTIRDLQRSFRHFEKDRVIIDGRPGFRAKDFWM